MIMYVHDCVTKDSGSLFPAGFDKADDYGGGSTWKGFPVQFL